MSAASIIAEFVEAQGWNDETVRELLTEYIDNQQSPEALHDFLSERCAPQDEKASTPWALFIDDSSPAIQRIDEEAEAGQTDDDAAISFVKALERGDREALAAAEVFLIYYGKA